MTRGQQRLCRGLALSSSVLVFRKALHARAVEWELLANGICNHHHLHREVRDLDFLPPHPGINKYRLWHAKRSGLEACSLTSRRDKPACLQRVGKAQQRGAAHMELGLR